MEKRRQQRNRRRVTCELVVDGKHHPAIVRDVSRAGLFVQTRARPELNSAIELVFPAEGDRPEIRVEAGVARERVAPAGLESDVPGGIGLEVLDAPPAYHELVAEAGMQSAGPEPAAGTGPVSDPGVRTFRVRLIERGTPNAMVLTVRSESAEGARARALTRAGRGWKIAAIQEI